MSNPNYQPKAPEQSPNKDDGLPEEKVSYHNLSEPFVHKEHKWIQQGPDLICKSCPAHHGIRIGVKKRLTGFDKDGNIILTNV